MEATKKVGGPNPSGPQGHPSAGSQQLGGGLRGSQGPWISSGPLYFQQGLSLSTETIIDGTCDPVSLAHVPEPIHQLLQNPAEVSSQGGYDQPSQEVLRFSTASVFSRPIVGAQPRLVMDDGTVSLPVCTPSDGISDAAQHRLCHSRLQVRLREEGKTPSKVLVGWGKGPCSPDLMVPPGTRKSRWLPYFISGEDNADKDQSPLLAPAVAPAQDQGQGQGLHPAPAPSLGAAPPLPVAPAAPAQADTPAPGGTPVPVAAETHPGTPDHLPDTNTANQDLSQDRRRSVFLESSNSSHQDKGDFHSKEGPPTPAPPLEEFPDHAQEHKVAGRQGPLEQPENSVEKPQVYTSGLGSSTPGPEPPGTPKSQRTNQEMCSSQPDKQPPNICNKTCSSVPVPPYGVTYPGQFPVQAPREAMPIPSSAPTCQLREAVEDRVLVFDMATGSTRMGLLCHDPMGSRAVLVGPMPSHPSVYAPENTLPTQPLARPFLSPEGNSSSFWPTTSVLSSPVPSSLSSGSYREVALVPKEARLNLDSPGTESPLRVGVLTGPVPVLMPLQFGERRLTHVPDPSWPKQDAEKNEPSHTIWMLDSSRLPDAALVQTKKLQWMNSEPAPPASTQEVPRSLPPEGTDSHNQKEVITAHPDNPQAKGSGQAPLIGQPILNGQALLPGQAPSTKKQPSLPDQPPVAGKTPLGRQLSLTRQASLTEKTIVSNEPPISKEPTLTRGPPTTGESGQASTQEGEPLGLSTNMGVLRVTPAPEETWGYLGGEKVGMGSTRSLSMHGVSSWQPGSSPRTQEEQLSLLTCTTPGTGCNVLPTAMVGAEPQSALSGRFKLTAEDVTHSSVVTHLGLLRGTCYELVSTMEAVPVQSPVLCRHPLGLYEDMAAVVIDTGTGFTKCGLAGEDHVLSVVPSQVQLLQHASQGQPRYAVPENREGSHPVLNRGVVSDWDALEVLWQHLFYCRLGVQPEELAVLVADSPISPRTNREKVAEILFERFHVPAMQTVHQALLALYACGRTTGLVLGSGHGTSYVAPILTGDLAPLDTYRLDVAGADLTEYLAQLLAASGQALPKAGLANQIKEAACYVAMNMAAERACTKDQARVDFVLPDKQVITLGSERFCCPEALFQPNLLGLNQPGLPQLALLSIGRLEAKQQEQLLANVVLEGGSTLLSGFPERLKQELGPRASVLSSPHRAVAAWLGGSIMASRDSFQSLWLRRREYEEEGPWAIYKYQL